jgi:hypothetical protein
MASGGTCTLVVAGQAGSMETDRSVAEQSRGWVDIAGACNAEG